MMERRNPFGGIRFFLCAGCLLLVVGSLNGQQETEVLSFIGYEFGVPQAIRREPGSVNLERFRTEGLGYSTNHTLRFGLGYAPQQLRFGPLGIEARLFLASSGGRFISDPYDNRTGTVDTSDIPEIPVSTRNEFEVLADESQIRIEVMARWEAPFGMEIGLGPWIGYRTTSSISQKERILSPGNAVFTYNHTVERIVAAGDPITSFRWRFGGILGIAREFPLGPSLQLRPELFTEFDSEALFDKKLGGRAFSVGMNLGFALALSAPSSPPLASAADTLPSDPPSLSLTASINLYNADTPTTPDEAVILSRPTVYTSYIPLLPVIRFAPNRVELPSSLHILSPDQATDFAEEQLIDREPELVRADLLNIVGERMRKNGEATITLTGIRKKEEEEGTSSQRMEETRRYLTERWTIDPARVRLGNTTEGTESLVRLEADDPMILAPLVQRWTSREHTGSNIGLQKLMEAEAGVERWEILLRLGDSIIGRYSSEKGNEMREIIELSFAGLEDREETMFLDAELRVTDRAGTTATARDQLPLVHRFDEGKKKEIRRWFFLSPADDPSLTEVNSAFVQSIAEAARDGSRLTVESNDGAISGEWNREGIAQKVLAALRSANITPREITIKEAETVGTDGVVVRMEE